MRVYKEKILHYTQIQIFDVINDIEAYSSYVPWCNDSKILWQKEDFLEGMIEINFMLLNYRFSTINKINRPFYIDMNLKSGPFKSLQGHWRFEHLTPQKTKVCFDINFEFNNFVLNNLFNSFFEKICLEFIDVFDQRLLTLYPNADPP